MKDLILSDGLLSISCRALTAATRFDASTKALARLSLFKFSIVSRCVLNNGEYNYLNQGFTKIANSNVATESLKFKYRIGCLLNCARESRNEITHEATLGSIDGFDK